MAWRIFFEAATATRSQAHPERRRGAGLGSRVRRLVLTRIDILSQGDEDVALRVQTSLEGTIDPGTNQSHCVIRKLIPSSEIYTMKDETSSGNKRKNTCESKLVDLCSNDDEITLQTNNDHLSVSDICGYFGVRVRGLSYQDVHQNSNGQHPLRRNIFINTRNKDFVQVPEGVTKFKVLFTDGEPKRKQPSDRKKPKEDRKSTATSIVRKYSDKKYKDESKDEKEEYVQFKVGVKFRLRDNEKFVAVQKNISGKPTLCLDRSVDYTYDELVNLLMTNCTNTITKIMTDGSTMGIGSFTTYYPSFLTHEKHPKPVSFWKFHDDEQSGLKKMNNFSTIYLYATANEELKCDLTANDTLEKKDEDPETDTGVKKTERQTLKRTSQVLQSDSDEPQLKIPKNESEDKKTRKDAMRAVIRHQENSSKPTISRTAVSQDDDHSKKFQIDPKKQKKMTTCMLTALKNTKQFGAEAPILSKPASKPKILQIEMRRPNSIVDQEVIALPVETSTPQVSPLATESKPIKEEITTYYLDDDDDEIIVLTDSSSDEENSLPGSTVTNEASHPPTTITLQFCAGNGKELTVTTREPLGSSDGVRTAEKYNVTARNIEVEDFTFELNKDKEPVSVGRGSNGEVFLGQFQGDLVAIKEIGLYNYDKKIQILREIAINDRVRGSYFPNLLAFNFDEDAMVARLLSEFVKGCQLREALFDTTSRHPKLDSLEKQLGVAKQLSSSVEYLHSNNPPIIHGDLKPENITLTPDLRIKIHDFGSSRFDGLPTQLRVSQCHLPNTYIYLSPDILVDGLDINEKSDVWAACCIILEIFIGKRAWMDEVNPSEEAMRDLLLTQKKPDLSGVRSELIPILDKGFEWNREDRYSAQELNKHLQDISWKESS
ncbi:hypothetical protein QAD02_009445 [Eretmocerus hayati]|uniref:Uncharacterized protein n=1 Tax=Eretmocerus hayati TaxID=131215 RepID=A0ACC2NBQ2_9HYME|nr:hypothetical protein QAD02_009445 [Eretmocerus hayati]